jgi:hypothetical protein
MKTLAILVLSIASAFSATRQQIEDAIQTRWLQIVPTIRNRQAIYFANHGHYFTGVKTHSVAPDDGAETAPDRANANEPGFGKWSDFISLPSNMNAVLEIHNYVTPAGEHGYYATLRFTKNGNTYVRSLNVEGPQNSFSHGWRIEENVTPEEAQQ